MIRAARDPGEGRTAVQPATALRGYTLAGGLDLSGSPSAGGQGPRTDYEALRQRLNANVVDGRSIATDHNPLVRSVHRLLGPDWAIAVALVLRGSDSQAIILGAETVGFRTALLARLAHRQLPLFVICHNVATRRPALFLRLGVTRAISRLLCLSDSQTAILADRFGISSQSVSVIYHQVDADFFKPDPRPPDEALVCSAGMACRDYATLVEAVRGLPVRLRIAADSTWFQQPLNVDVTSIPPNVEVRSTGDYRGLRALYARAQFVVVPLLDVEYSAGYAVILEAMAMGKAVIVSQTRQPDDFVIDGWNGYRVPAGDVPALRQRIVDLLRDPEQVAIMGARGRQLVETRFSLDHYVNRVLQALP